jgi:hypothetical protein
MLPTVQFSGLTDPMSSLEEGGAFIGPSLAVNLLPPH